jgi:hypothetical protein
MVTHSSELDTILARYDAEIGYYLKRITLNIAQDLPTGEENVNMLKRLVLALDDGFTLLSDKLEDILNDIR